jgi:hypothetical protein
MNQPEHLLYSSEALTVGAGFAFFRHDSVMRLEQDAPGPR